MLSNNVYNNFQLRKSKNIERIIKSIPFYFVVIALIFAAIRSLIS